MTDTQMLLQSQFCRRCFRMAMARNNVSMPFSRSMRPANRIPRNHRMILFAGRIERLKGIDTLFRAMAILKQRRHNWDWSNICVSVIGGDPSEEGQRENEEMGRLHDLRDDSASKTSITFLGARDQDALRFDFSLPSCW